ncbi:MAG TPA: cytochrome c oxidase assembly protein, partial [Solirubrobacterales bacterium]|nr:cytochrome c oxidase assembly protein [Solirubrobacterales bacterium]
MFPAADLDSVLAEWLPPLSLIVIAVAYAIRMIRLGDAGRPVPRRRQAFFLGGLIALAIAYVSPVDDLSDELLTWHMVQHLLIIDIAALLFVLGLTGPLMQPLLALRGFRWMR